MIHVDSEYDQVERINALRACQARIIFGKNEILGFVSWPSKNWDISMPKRLQRYFVVGPSLGQDGRQTK
jgi:hypothetical protein